MRIISFITVILFTTLWSPPTAKACDLENIIPDIKDLEIAEARELLFEYGWRPIKAEEIEWMASERTKTPELTSCTAFGLFMCHYTYETNNAYLEVVTKGEPEPTVSVVEGRCN